ncbi:MAG: ArsA-related P-loop ATPase [Dehalococcoidia bacterium]|nr:ArsA-related P-loop ATPase [Dehalococcoidia bacterium]
MRVIVFSGKGGSGVSTLAAATAAAVAEGGLRTLAFGLAPGLGAAFGAPLLPEAQPVAGRLEALEGHSGAGASGEFRDWLEALLDWRGMDVELAGDLAGLPGLNHVGRLLELERCLDAGYDAVIVDGGPLSQFLDLPAALDAAARWLDRLFAPRQQTVFDPFLRVFAGEYASAGEGVLDRGRDLLGRLARLRDVLTDRQVSSVRLALPPAAGAAAEAQQAVAALSLYSFATDALALCRLLPAAVADPFFQPARGEQTAALAEARGSLAPLPVLEAPLAASAPRGVPALAAFARSVYGGRDPAAVLHAAPSHSFSRDGDNYRLTLALPFARREDVRLEQLKDAIAIHLNGRRCLLTLPPEVRYRQAGSWSFDGQSLTVTFER